MFEYLLFSMPVMRTVWWRELDWMLFLGGVCYGCHLKEGVYIANLLSADQYFFVI